MFKSDPLMFSYFFKKQKPLYERIGGEETVKLIADLFYSRVREDDTVGFFFRNAEMAKLKPVQVAYFIRLLGGPEDSIQSNITSMHRPEALSKLDGNHLDIMQFHLTNVMRELDLDDTIILEVYTIAEAIRAKLLCSTIPNALIKTN